MAKRVHGLNPIPGRKLCELYAQLAGCDESMKPALNAEIDARIAKIDAEAARSAEAAGAAAPPDR